MCGARSENRTRTPFNGQGILSPSCLPIPPPAQNVTLFVLEAPTGVEPVYAVLQTAA